MTEDCTALMLPDALLTYHPCHLEVLLIGLPDFDLSRLLWGSSLPPIHLFPVPDHDAGPLLHVSMVYDTRI